jgi:hypothetical protein
MVATQQVWENNDMGALVKERLTVVLTCRKWWLNPMQKVAMTHSKPKALLLKRDIKPITKSTTAT